MSAEMFEEDDLTPRQVDWRLWRRILGHLKPFPRAVATMTGCGVILAAVEVSLPLVTARIIDAASGLQGEDDRFLQAVRRWTSSDRHTHTEGERAETAGFPVPVIASQVAIRLHPKILYVAPLLYLAPNSHNKLNRLQVRWGKTILVRKSSSFIRENSFFRMFFFIRKLVFYKGKQFFL